MSGLGWLAGGVATVLLLAGCSGDEPRAEPPRPSAPRTSPVATTSPSPTPPALPAAARENSKAGAVAFAHHYIDLINYATEYGHVNELLRASDKGCGACQEMCRFIQQVYSHGGDIHGGMWLPRSYSALADGPDRWLVAIEIDAKKQFYRPRADAESVLRTGGRYTVSLYPAWKRQGWVIERLASTR